MAKLPVNLSKARNAERVYSNAAKRYDGLARASKEAGNSAEARIYSKAASRMRFHEKSVSGAIKRGNIAEVQQTINASSQYTAKATSSKRARGEALGNALLEGTNAGHRFFAITKDIWQGSAYGDRWSALKEHFGDITPAEMIPKPMSQERVAPATSGFLRPKKPRTTPAIPRRRTAHQAEKPV